jgi:hypothetical protein
MSTQHGNQGTMTGQHRLTAAGANAQLIKVLADVQAIERQRESAKN